MPSICCIGVICMLLVAGPAPAGSGALVDCATPLIDSHDPVSVTVDNCSAGCVVSFIVRPILGGYDPARAKVTLERQLGTSWVPEDSILAPLPSPAWTLRCDFDEHFADGNHVFRAVISCTSDTHMPSLPVTVAANRGVPVEATTWGRIKGLFED